MTAPLQSAEPLYSSLGDDPDLGELVEMFVSEMPDRIAAIRASHSSGDRESLRRTAHQLKGAAGSYGFDTITAEAAKLEKRVRENAADEQVLAAVQELVALCQRATAGAP